MFIRNFGSLFGRHFAQISKPEQIVGKFNATCSGKVVIFADEAFYAGDKKSLGALKVVITEPRLAIERKGVDPVQEDNFVHLFMASNEDWHTPPACRSAGSSCSAWRRRTCRTPTTSKPSPRK
jgi:hypothetical protein